MPSFFFHVSVDLQTKSSHLEDIADANKNILRYRRTVIHREKTTPDLAEIASGSEGRSLAIKDEGTHSSASQEEITKPEEHAHCSSDLNRGEGQHLTKDWRCGIISFQSINMVSSTHEGDDEVSQQSKTSTTRQEHNGTSKSLFSVPGGLATKGKFEPSDSGEEELGWGIVRLYRDADETPGLYDAPSAPSKHNKSIRGGKRSQQNQRDQKPAFKDEDCTTLCILAVPSYLTPSDFLGFVGEKTREDVSHFRMIRTERSNRYMVLMKFRNGRRAREWRKEWNGRVFDGMQTEYCHVVFVKSVEFRALDYDDIDHSFPDVANDPLTASKTNAADSSALVKAQQSNTASTSLGSKPMAPPTPSLIELPICPVCLERMDESTGLLTIHCQHVFHCTCLMKWRGSGCPVCRFTQEGAVRKASTTEGDSALNECSICQSDENLWICLLCGNVGCGRYDNAHAKLHYEQTFHGYAMDLNSQRVWDYALDGYVHRIMQSKTDGKLMELPSALGNYDHNRDHSSPDEDLIPREKLDSISLEYTHLLTSQLDSQRLYFEEKLERAADKASKASASATQATEASNVTLAQLESLQLSHKTLENDAVPTLERDRDRALRKASRFEDMARSMEKRWGEEKVVSKSLMERIAHLDKEVAKLKEEKIEIEDANRDLLASISGSKTLRELDMGDEVVLSTLSVEDAEQLLEDEQERTKAKKKKNDKKRARERARKMAVAAIKGRGAIGEASASASISGDGDSEDNGGRVTEIKDEEDEETGDGKLKMENSTTVAGEDDAQAVSDPRGKSSKGKGKA